MIEPIKKILRQSEQYTKTDMVYLTQGGFWLALGQATNMLLGAILTIAFANLISAEKYGIYKYILSVSVIVSGFSLTGMNAAITRAVAMGKEGYVQKSFWYQLKWNTTIILSLTVIAAIYYFTKGNNVLALGMLLIGICTPITNAANTYSAYLQGKKKYRLSFLFSMPIMLVSTAAILLTLFLSEKVLVIIGVYFVINALTYTAAYLLTLKTLRPNTLEDEETKRIGQDLSITNFFGAIAKNIDKVIAFQSIGASALAIYSFATVIPAQFGSLAKMISTLAFPKIVERYTSTGKVSYIRKVIQLIIVFSILAGIYILLAPAIYKLLLPKYINAVHYSQIASLIFIFTAPNLYLQGILQVQAQKKTLYSYSVVTSIIQTALMAGLGYTYGLMGLIVAHILSSVVGTIYALALLSQKVRPRT